MEVRVLLLQLADASGLRDGAVYLTLQLSTPLSPKVRQVQEGRAWALELLELQAAQWSFN